jgi:hypothetical protein
MPGMVELQLLREAGWVAWVQLAVLALGVFWALVCAVLLGMRWKVPAALSTAVLGLHAFLVIVGVSWATSSAGAAGGDPAQRATMLAMAVSGAVASGALALCALPSAMLLALGGMAGGVRGPRAFVAPVFVLLACGLAALLPLGGLVVHASLPWVLVKVLVYGGGVIPVAASLLGAGMDTNGRESAVAATIAYFSAVAATELASVSMSWAQVFGAIANVDPEQRGALLRVAAEEIASASSFGWASILLALVAVLVAAFRPALPPTEEEIMNGKANPSALRALGTIFALAVPAIWLVALYSADPVDLVLGIAAR